MKIGRVLLVCSGNTCRSPMAAALLKQLWDQAGPAWDLEVISAGTGCLSGQSASEHALAAMQQRGIDLSGHRSQPVQGKLLDEVDLILTMTKRHKEWIHSLWPQVADHLFTLGEYAGNDQDVPDPFGGSFLQYDEVARNLERQMQAVIERIRREEIA